jgi:hypothetical protein
MKNSVFCHESRTLSTDQDASEGGMAGKAFAAIR